MPAAFPASRSRKGQKRMSPEMASRIVDNSQGDVSYEELVNFERTVSPKEKLSQKPKTLPSL